MGATGYVIKEPFDKVNGICECDESVCFWWGPVLSSVLKETGTELLKLDKDQQAIVEKALGKSCTTDDRLSYAKLLDSLIVELKPMIIGEDGKILSDKEKNPNEQERYYFTHFNYMGNGVGQFSFRQVIIPEECLSCGRYKAYI